LNASINKKGFLFFTSLLLANSAALADTPDFGCVVNKLKQGHVLFQLGGFSATQGQSQQINIQNLIGNYYTVSQNTSQNALVGIGYFLDGTQYNRMSFLYGINAFYLFDNVVNGNIWQEQLFNNLSYSYNVSNIPIYVTAKTLFKMKNERYSLALDLGIGPNFMRTNSYQEKSLDGGVTIPDNAFSGRTTTNFSATAGIGFKVANALDNVPLECGYRFFYLGQGSFSRDTNQLLDSLQTGKSYAQAITCGITL
jgi:hypothetical protein